MKRICWGFILILGVSQAGLAQTKQQPKTREFLFTYSGTVTGLKPNTTARIWLPIPQSNDDQQIKIVSTKFPAKPRTTIEPKYRNKLFYLEAKANAEGDIPFSVVYRVKRWEVFTDQRSKMVEPNELSTFLKSNKNVPIGGKPSMVLLNKINLPKDQLAAAQTLYDIVNEHMKYDKSGVGWGRGDAAWACDSRFGNCSDFHSLFISLARSSGLPAKFEIGFPLPIKRGKGKIGGYHCWAKFAPMGRGWIPVDISAANQAKKTDPKLVKYFFGNLTQDRVAFTQGRDLTLSPKQSGPPVNFLVYPYVEVNGEPYPSSMVQRSFSFEDLN